MSSEDRRELLLNISLEEVLTVSVIEDIIAIDDEISKVPES